MHHIKITQHDKIITSNANDSDQPGYCRPGNTERERDSNGKMEETMKGEREEELLGGRDAGRKRCWEEERLGDASRKICWEEEMLGGR